MQEGREGPPPRLGLGEACLGVPCPEGRAKGHVFPLPHPMTVSLSHRATLSVRDPEASGLRPEQKDPEWDASFSTPRSRPLLRHPTTELRIPVAGALGDTQTEPSLDQVLQERDEAIAKKRAVEAELHTCKAKLRAVEAQLLEVLEEKLRLRQEVEAWEVEWEHQLGLGVWREGHRVGPKPTFLPPGGHAAAGEAAGPESAGERVQGCSGSPHGPQC
ncbi:uncharacterized protein LOC114008996 isoform X1 [Tupaia chinensis]|uniref:uncharacterized protein LOC114008996 isoform X1 n=1 Tax=Tupaia chinensis TaxID=246437 RepID=UPI000FFC8146|nr:uncharacterized protein LOC114008996 isoform X1 [Tupaia chinensis]